MSDIKITSGRVENGLTNFQFRYKGMAYTLSTKETIFYDKEDSILKIMKEKENWKKVITNELHM